MKECNICDRRHDDSQPQKEEAVFVVIEGVVSFAAHNSCGADILNKVLELLTDQQGHVCGLCNRGNVSDLTHLASVNGFGKYSKVPLGWIRVKNQWTLFHIHCIEGLRRFVEGKGRYISKTRKTHVIITL